MTLISSSFIPSNNEPYQDDFEECSADCSSCTPPPSYDRKQADPLKYNDSGLWKTDPPGGIIPNWNGLNVRNRGSSIGICQFPWNGYILNQRPTFLNGSNEDNINSPLNHINWNNIIPAGVVISAKHFLSTTHFHPVSENCTNGECPEDPNRMFTIRLRTDENTYTFKTAYKRGSKGDITLFKFDVPLTEEQVSFIKPYKIVKSDTIPAGSIIWKQNPNGTFIVGYVYMPAYYKIDENGQSILYNVHEHDEEMVKSYYEINSTYPNYKNVTWSGHSGSPLLVTTTANDETYLHMLSKGGGHVYLYYDYLKNICEADGVSLPPLVDLGHKAVVVNFISPLSIPPYNSRFII